jgi:hypothetical protein
VNPLDEAIKDLTRILGIVDVGTADRPRQMAAIVVTIERIKSWRHLPAPTSDDGRGGSSSPKEIAERLEDRKVGRAAERHAQALAKHLEGIANIVAIYTTATEYEGIGGEPGCVSCARKGEKPDGRKLGGHFKPVVKKYKSRRLCRWCGEHSTAGRMVDLDLMDLSHREGENKASREYAKRYMPKVVA